MYKKILRGKSALSDFYYAFKLDNFTINLFILREKMFEENIFNVMLGRRFFLQTSRQFLNFSLSSEKNNPRTVVMKHAVDKTLDVMTPKTSQNCVR